MRKILTIIAILTIILSFVFCLKANAMTINFDDLDASGLTNWYQEMDIPNGYQGMLWNDMEVIDNQNYRNWYNNSFDFPSQSTAAYNGSGIRFSGFSRNQNFNFDSGYFSAWTRNNKNKFNSVNHLIITGYDNGNFVDSIFINLKPGELVYFDLGLKNVNQIVFDTNNPNPKWFVMDSLEVSNVPIPGSFWLIGSGLVGIFSLRRKSSFTK